MTKLDIRIGLLRTAPSRAGPSKQYPDTLSGNAPAVRREALPKRGRAMGQRGFRAIQRPTASDARRRPRRDSRGSRISARTNSQHRDHGPHRCGQDHDDRARPLLHGRQLQDRRGPRGRRDHGLHGPGAGARDHDHVRRDELLLDAASTGPTAASATASTSSTRPATSTSPSRSSAACASSTARSRSSTAATASSRRARRSGARRTSTTCPASRS